MRNCCTYNAHTLQNQVRWLFQGDWIVGSTSYFFCCCCLKEQILDKPWLLRLGHLADIFFQMSKMSCHLKENNWKYLLPVIKYEFLSTNQSLKKMCICHHELDSFPKLKKPFSDVISSYINKCDFLILYYEMCQLGMIWIIQQTSIFQMVNAWYYEITHG